jgi:TfoX/Sxy family transcriptional regulator of competence genes
MTYDEKLAQRIRKVLPPDATIEERKMFGGVAFLLKGKMFVGVVESDLMVRIGAEAYDAALARPHVRPMDFTGRPLTGFVFVSDAGIRTQKNLGDWIHRAMTFVATLPATKKKPRSRPLATPKRKRKAGARGAASRHVRAE